MAITVNIYYSGQNGSARDFAQEMVETGLVDRIRAEEGNEQYDYFFPMDDPETVLLIDRWDGQSAIDRHHATTMMAEISQLRDKYNLHMRVERYVSDQGGIPDSDLRFVKS